MLTRCKNFFMSIPRNWSPFKAQADDWQTMAIAQPTALDHRFKAGAILAFFAWLLILVSLVHSVRHYRPWHGGLWRKTSTCLRTVPLQFVLTIPLLLVHIGYAAAQGWLWSINVANSDASRGVLYGLGSAPAVLILYVNIVAGLRRPNEDLALMQHRVERGAAVDAELGLDRRARKPWWWRRTAAELGLSNEAKLRRLAMANEVGGGRGISVRVDHQIELGALPGRPLAADEPGTPLRPNAGDMGACHPRGDHDSEAGEETRGRVAGTLGVDPRPAMTREDSESAVSIGMTSVEPQRIRSMLDV